MRFPPPARFSPNAPGVEEMTAKNYLSLLVALILTLGANIIAPVRARDSETNRPAAQDARGTFRAEANGSNTHRMRVRRGQNVRVEVHGDGDTDLDLFVYDPYGVEVARDTRPDDTCVAYFRANAGGIYTMRVTNLGDVWNQYSLAF